MHKLVRFWSPKDANITADYYEYGKGAKGPLWQSSHGELAEECQSQDDPPNVATACEAVPEARRRVWNGGVCATWQDFSNSGLLFTQGNLENRIGSHFHLMLRNISAVLWYRNSPTDHLQNLSFSPAWCGCTARCSEGCEIWQPVSACLSMSQLSTTFTLSRSRHRWSLDIPCLRSSVSVQNGLRFESLETCRIYKA